MQRRAALVRFAVICGAVACPSRQTLGVMHHAFSALVIIFAGFVSLWPLAWLIAVIRHALSKQWVRLGQVALLLPLWAVAASVSALQLARLFAVTDAKPSPSVWAAVASIGVGACVATVAWLLLFRSFGAQQPLEGSAR